MSLTLADILRPLLLIGALLLSAPRLAHGAAPAPATPATAPAVPQPPAWVAGYRVRYQLRVHQIPSKPLSRSIIATLPTGGWLNARGDDLLVVASDGDKLPFVVLSHVPDGDTIIQFLPRGQESVYWVYASNPALADHPHDEQARMPPEGLTVEFRRWEGDKLGAWPVVVQGLMRSETVTDNAVVTSVYQPQRPFRSDEPRNFAASYRGSLQIDKPGVYRFFVNADDTAFLFIDNYLVYSRTGTNPPLRGKVRPLSIGADLKLDAGVHHFEVHQVVGNTLSARGYAMLMWMPPGAKNWAPIPDSAFPRAALALPVAIQAADGQPVAIFHAGLDDTLAADGVNLYLMRFQATANTDPATLQWRFADGATATGQSLQHIYFQPGDTTVSLQSNPTVPPFRRTIHIQRGINPTAPSSLAQAVDAIAQLPLSTLDTPTLDAIHHFLGICGQTNRWPVLERVARELLSRGQTDIQQKVLLYGSLMRALAHEGKADEALKLLPQALKAADDVQTLSARVLLNTANLYRDVIHDFDQADALYQRIVKDNRRLRHPIIREAAIDWGDLYLDLGNRDGAAEAYRMARRLGQVGGDTTSNDPTARGALLRAVEQQLQRGDVRQSRRMLERIDQTYPEEKLDGLYTYLRAETERQDGEYEQAIRHYEAVMKLGEWASYHPSALRGIADSYYRMGAFADADKWYTALQTRYPSFYAAQKLTPIVKAIHARLESAPTTRPTLFTQAADNFDQPRPAPAPHDKPQSKARPVPNSLGFDGPATFRVQPAGQLVNATVLSLKDLPSQGTLWLEFWYRTQLGSIGADTPERYVSPRFFDENNQYQGEQRLDLPRTLGRWEKAVLQIPLPPMRSGRLEVRAHCGHEWMEIDAVKVIHVSDTQNYALWRFLEGADPQ